MDRADYRTLAMAVWGPILVVVAISVVQVFTGTATPLVDRIVSAVGETAFSTVFWVAFLAGGVSLVHSDIGETRA